MEDARPPNDPRFQTTRWSVVLEAGRDDSTARAALEELARCYWYPLFAFLRREGVGVHEAEDLVQGYLARLIERQDLEQVSQDRGRFRSYLLTGLKNHRHNVHEQASAQKRGGGRPVQSLNADEADRRYQLEPADDLTPERLFERSFAHTVLERTLAVLRDRQAPDRRALFEELLPHLTGAGQTTYAELAERHATTEGALKVTVHRLRQRFAALLREEITALVSTPEEVEDEIQHLFRVL